LYQKIKFANKQIVNKTTEPARRAGSVVS